MSFNDFNDKFKNGLEDVSIEDDCGGETAEEKSDKAAKAGIQSDHAQQHDSETAQKLRAVKIMMHARSFEKAKQILSALEKSEEDRNGYCDNPEIYWCKLLLKYQVRDESEIIAKELDIENDEEYILAVDFCKTDEQRQRYQSIPAKIKQAQQDKIDAERRRREEERRRKEEEERKRREEEARLQAIREEEDRKRKEEEACQRAIREEEERKRKEEEARQRAIREEAERKRKEEEERKRIKAERLRKEEEERQRKLREEEERRHREEEECKRKEEEIRKTLLNLGEYKDIGRGYVTFGTYPQSKKSEDVQVGKIFDKARKYYLGDDNNIYAEWQGEYYKVEPIKWKVSQIRSETILVAYNVLDAHSFGTGSNSYNFSDIRKFINGEFYDKAFNDSQKAKIVATSLSSYYSSNKDKVFLLSDKEAYNLFNSNNDRQKKGSDYAKARNLYSVSGFSWWWLSSPHHDYYSNSLYEDIVTDKGSIDHRNVENGRFGVVPAIKIKL